MTAVSFQLSRPHRFQVGDYCRHVDADENDPASRILIEAQSVRIGTDGMAHPTYTVSSRSQSIKETYEDILDTDDLVKMFVIRAHFGDAVDARASRR